MKNLNYYNARVFLWVANTMLCIFFIFRCNHLCWAWCIICFFTANHFSIFFSMVIFSALLRFEILYLFSNREEVKRVLKGVLLLYSINVFKCVRVYKNGVPKFEENSLRGKRWDHFGTEKRKMLVSFFYNGTLMIIFKTTKFKKIYIMFKKKCVR